MSTQTASASAGPAGSTLRLMDHWVAGMEFDTFIKELRAAGVPEDGEGPITVAKFILNANVAATSQERFDDESLADSQVGGLQAERRGNV